MGLDYGLQVLANFFGCGQAILEAFINQDAVLIDNLVRYRATLRKLVLRRREVTNWSERRQTAEVQQRLTQRLRLVQDLRLESRADRINHRQLQVRVLIRWLEHFAQLEIGATVLGLASCTASMPTVNVEWQLLPVLEMAEHRDLLAGGVVDVVYDTDSNIQCLSE